MTNNNVEMLRRKCLIICCTNSAEEYYSKMNKDFDRKSYMAMMNEFSTDDLAELLSYQLARVHDCTRKMNA